MASQYSPINNPFALLNLSADASGVKINSQFQRLFIRAELTCDASSPYILLLRKASEHLRDPLERFRYSLFWLTLTEEEEALFSKNEILSKIGSDWPDDAEGEFDTIVSSSNLTNRMHNKAVLLLGKAMALGRKRGAASKKLWSEALNSWSLVIQSEDFWSAIKKRAVNIDDPRLNDNEILRWRESFSAYLLKLCSNEATVSLKSHDDKTARHWIHIIRKSPFSDRVIDDVLGTIYEPFTQRIELQLDALDKQISARPSKGELKQALLKFKRDVLAGITQLISVGDLPGYAEERARDHAAQFLRSLSIECFNNDLIAESNDANEIAITVVDKENLKEKLLEEKVFLQYENLIKPICKKIDRGQLPSALKAMQDLINQTTDSSLLVKLREFKSRIEENYAEELLNASFKAFKSEVDGYSFPDSSSAQTLRSVKSKLNKARRLANSSQTLGMIAQFFPVLESFIEKVELYEARLRRQASIIPETHHDFSTILPNRNRRTIPVADKTCFVATATFYSQDHETVRSLRSYRDEILANCPMGRLFIKAYWKIGPLLAKMVHQIPLTRLVLKPMLNIISKRLVATASYKARMLNNE